MLSKMIANYRQGAGSYGGRIGFLATVKLLSQMAMLLSAGGDGNVHV